MGWEIVEQSSRPKTGNLLHNEDGLLTGPRYWGVIDAASGPASPKAGPDEPTAGHTITEIIKQVFIEHGRQDFPALIRLATQKLADWKNASQRQPFVKHGGAFICVYDAEQHCIWRLGDCWARSKDKFYTARLPLEEIYVNFRIPMLEALQVQQRHDEMAAKEQELVGLYMIFHALGANNSDHPLGFGALSGDDVPEKFIIRHELSNDTDLLVFGSDGYMNMAWTLAENEAEIERLRRDDPWLIKAHGVKAFKAGLESFDDRSFLKIRKTT